MRLQFHTVPVSGQPKPEVVPLSLVNSSTKHFFTASSAKVLVNRELRAGAG